MQEPRLSPVSYVVLGLLEWFGTSTPYELKGFVKESIGNFWTLQHAQLYTEPERLESFGYVTEEREDGGRRRKRYTITDAGRQALREWRETPTAVLSELRDQGLLKLFFGADPAQLAATELERHRAKLAHYEAIKADDDGRGPRGPFLALQAGLRHEREWIAYWEALADGEM